MIQEAGFIDRVFNVITGDGTAGVALSANPAVDTVASRVVKAASGKVKKVSLELGGKSPGIGFPYTNMDVTIPGTASSI